jgi:predicted protein tyrosine phosphatase
MVDQPRYPPLRSLHPDSSINPVKLAQLERLSTEILIQRIAGTGGLSENPAGRNYTGWASPHPRSSPTRCGCRRSSAGDRRKGSRARMRKELYWLDGRPWRRGPAAETGCRTICPAGSQAGANTVLSLLTPEEEDLDLRQEAGKAKKLLGLEFASFPIPDRQIPRSEAKWADILARVTRRLTDGKNVVVHCRQGIGRTGLVAACLLVRKGMSRELRWSWSRLHGASQFPKPPSREIGSTTMR